MSPTPPCRQAFGLESSHDTKTTTCTHPSRELVHHQSEYMGSIASRLKGASDLLEELMLGQHQESRYRFASQLRLYIRLVLVLDTPHVGFRVLGFWALGFEQG